MGHPSIPGDPPLKQNRIYLVPTSEIIVTREARQRSDLTPESILELACSIAKSGNLIQPISIDGDTSEIIAGERRLTSFQILEKVSSGDWSSFAKPDAAREVLEPVLPNAAPYDGWTKIPTQKYHDITQVERLVLEFTENHQRTDISWQDKGKAAYEIHKLLAQSHEGPGRWGDKHTAEELSIATSYFSRIVTPFRALEVAHEEVKSKVDKIVAEAPSARSAELAIERVVSRREAAPTLRIGSTAQRAAAPPPPPKPKAELPTSELLICADFKEFARTYEAEPFNFLCCDFPYGINYNIGGGQRTSVLTQLEGAYDDSAEIYWDLLGALLKHRDKLISPSAHIMFWFSQNHRRETEDLIKDSWPDAVIQQHLMIWHMSDNSGLTPDPQRYGRRNYETAMLITLGDRKIASPRSLSFSAPRGKDKIHRSQKSIEVLQHFFGMFVDSSTRMLDPTAGSGSSLIAAKLAGAKQVLGLEIDPEAAAAGAKFVNDSLRGAA